MTLLVFLGFLLITIFQSSAELSQSSAELSQSSAELSQSSAELFQHYGGKTEAERGISSASTTGYHEIKWSPDNIFSLQACVTFNDTVDSSGTQEDSKLFLTMSTRYDPNLSLFVQFPLTKLDASHRFCHVFDACKIAKQLEGKVWSEVQVVAYALINFPDGVDNTARSYHLSLRAVSYFYDHPGSVSIINAEENTLHSVVCKFPNCIVNAESKFIVGKYYFSPLKGAGPKCETEKDQLTDGMFSVTDLLFRTDCPKHVTTTNGTTATTKTQNGSPTTSPTTTAIIPITPVATEKVDVRAVVIGVSIFFLVALVLAIMGILTIRHLHRKTPEEPPRSPTQSGHSLQDDVGDLRDRSDREFKVDEFSREEGYFV